MAGKYHLKLCLMKEQICWNRYSYGFFCVGDMMELKSALLYSRFAKYYRDAEGVDYRTLMKAYGIRFDVMVNGKVRSQARLF